MRWEKRGLIFTPQGQARWVGTHAALPASVRLHDRERVFLSSRDPRGRSHIGYVDLSLADSMDVIEVSEAAVLSPGDLGTFDDAGVTSACVVRRGGRLFLYYTGWTLGVTVPFYLNVGLAVSDDEGRSFRRWSRAPLLERNHVDPYLTASPWVLEVGNVWRMWYVSGTQWIASPDRPRHRYHIKYAESANGFDWMRAGCVCIDYASPDEHAFSRPCVLHDGSRFQMWYSYRGEQYRLGHAESADGVEWVRRDASAGMAPSTAGWDSEMIAYPLVTAHGNTYRMLYNGNGYGRTGVGLAISA